MVFKEEFDRQREEKEEEEHRQWEEYMSDVWTEDEEEDDHPWYWKCNLIW